MTKRFTIREVTENTTSNAPFEIMLQTEPWRGRKESSLTLNAQACARHGIPRSLGVHGEVPTRSSIKDRHPRDSGCIALCQQA